LKLNQFLKHFHILLNAVHPLTPISLFKFVLFILLVLPVCAVLKIVLFLLLPLLLVLQQVLVNASVQLTLLNLFESILALSVVIQGHPQL